MLDQSVLARFPKLSAELYQSNFRLGRPIPKDAWESHNLIAEDFDDD